MKRLVCLMVVLVTAGESSAQVPPEIEFLKLGLQIKLDELAHPTEGLAGVQSVIDGTRANMLAIVPADPPIHRQEIEVALDLAQAKLDAAKTFFNLAVDHYFWGDIRIGQQQWANASIEFGMGWMDADDAKLKAEEAVVWVLNAQDQINEWIP